MKSTRIFVLLLLFPALGTSLFSQEKRFSSFQLLYDIPQQIETFDNWPEYFLEPVRIYNDTLFTLLAKEGCRTAIPLNTSQRKITHTKTYLPPNSLPIRLMREKGKWIYVTERGGILQQTSDSTYRKLVEKEQLLYFQDLFFIKDRMVVFESSGWSGVFCLYDLDGKHLFTTPCVRYPFYYPMVLDNKIINGDDQVSLENDTLSILGGDEVRSFIGSNGTFAYYSEIECTRVMVIKKFSDPTVEEMFFVPIDSDEEYRLYELSDTGPTNLRVFSKDNRTFYFVKLRGKHLKIYRAIR